MNSSTALLAPDALEMLTRHNTNSPQDVFQHPALKRKLALSSLWQHMIYSKFQTMSCVSPKASSFISMSKSALHTHTHTLRAKVLENTAFFSQASAQCLHCPLYKCACWSLCIHIAGDAVHRGSLTSSLLSPGPQTLAPGFNGTYFLGSG